MTKQLDLQQFLPYRCTRLAQRISLSLSRIYSAEFGVSIPEWRVLATLAAEDGLLAKQVGERTSMDKVRVSRAVAALQERGLLDKRPCQRDSRASLLSLSAQGEALYQRIEPLALNWENDLVGPLSSAERQALTRIMDKLEQRLDNMVQEAEQ